MSIGGLDFRDIDFDFVEYEQESDYDAGCDTSSTESGDGESDVESEAWGVCRRACVLSDRGGPPVLVFEGDGVVCFGRLCFSLCASPSHVMSVIGRNDYRIGLLLEHGLRYLFMDKFTGEVPSLPLLPWSVRDIIASMLVDRSVVCDLVGCYQYVLHYGKLCPCVRAEIGCCPWYYARSVPVGITGLHWSYRLRQRREVVGSSCITEVSESGAMYRGRPTMLFRRYRERQLRKYREPQFSTLARVRARVISPPRFLHLLNTSESV
jgi:hypothetical protein